MTPQIAYQASPSTGFDRLLRRRAVMQQWSAVSHLMMIRKNQEAAEIVASFQRQMELQSSISAASNDKAA